MTDTERAAFEEWVKLRAPTWVRAMATSQHVLDGLSEAWQARAALSRRPEASAESGLARLAAIDQELGLDAPAPAQAMHPTDAHRAKLRELRERLSRAIYGSEAMQLEQFESVARELAELCGKLMK